MNFTRPSPQVWDVATRHLEQRLLPCFLSMRIPLCFGQQLDHQQPKAGYISKSMSGYMAWSTRQRQKYCNTTVFWHPKLQKVPLSLWQKPCPPLNCWNKDLCTYKLKNMTWRGPELKYHASWISIHTKIYYNCMFVGTEMFLIMGGLSGFGNGLRFPYSNGKKL